MIIGRFKGKFLVHHIQNFKLEEGNFYFKFEILNRSDKKLALKAVHSHRYICNGYKWTFPRTNNDETVNRVNPLIINENTSHICRRPKVEVTKRGDYFSFLLTTNTFQPYETNS